ncbi:T9SS type A sorting domain-containing protein [candidate division KSB1 bacterium]
MKGVIICAPAACAAYRFYVCMEAGFVKVKMFLKKLFAGAVFILVPCAAITQDTGIIPRLSKAHLSSPVTSNEESFRLDGEQSLHLLAVRVEFLEDDDPLTSGTGKFDYTELTPAQRDSTVDPPPHNRIYFSDQLEALKRYYGHVSNGKVSLSFDIVPDGLEAAYTLPHEMRYYNPDTDDDELDLRLSELLRDALLLADNDPSVDFSVYDAVIIFHAGIGSDYLLEDPALDPTPHDIPSVHLGFDHLRRTLGSGDPGYQGIGVEGGARFITGGTILPETESKRSVQIGLLGIAAHQFGHELGLPSLFNTETGRPAIGKWGLMGVGFANLDGVVPAEPSAWCKVFMGWETPVVVVNGTGLAVAASRAPSGTKIYKIPVTPAEYFLVENRNQDYAEDGLHVVKGQSGVIIEVDDYDVDIPGSGLLIWHVDERVIRAKIAANRINADPILRGIDLEEADGSQDIGEIFPQLFPGFITPENGLPWDAYSTDINTEFTPVSVPASLSNYGGNSTVSVTGIGDAGPEMSFSVSKRFAISGFPWYIGGNFDRLPPAPAGQDLKLVLTGRDGSVYGITGSNESAVPAAGERTDPFGNLHTAIDPLISTGQALQFMPVIAPADFPFPEYSNKLYLIADSQTLMIYSLAAGDFGALLHETALPSGVTAQPALGSWLMIGFDDGSVGMHNGDGSLHRSVQLLPDQIIGFTGELDPLTHVQTLYALSGEGYVGVLSGDAPVQLFAPVFDRAISGPLVPLYSNVDREPGNELVALGWQGDIGISSSPTVNRLFGFSFSVDPAAGDINGDGVREIVTGSGNRIFALNGNGTMATGFPAELLHYGYEDIVTTDIILGDVNGDGKQDILFGTDKGNLFAVDDRGTTLPGFPLPLASSAVSAPVLLKSSSDDRLELAVLDADGYLYLWDLETGYSDKIIAWGVTGGNSAHLRHNTEALAPATGPESGALMPPDRVFNWPNPNTGNWTNIRYYLNHEASVNIRIYNQVGDLVANLTGPGMAQVDNELTWNLEGIDSGVYFAQVVASGHGLTEKKVIKIAVIK